MGNANNSTNSVSKALGIFILFSYGGEKQKRREEKRKEKWNWMGFICLCVCVYVNVACLRHTKLVGGGWRLLQFSH